MRAIDLKHLGQEHVICCWEVDGLLIDPGPQSCEETLLEAIGGERPQRAAADPHPLRPRRRRGCARAPLARPAGLCPRARRQAPRRPRAARRERGARCTAARRAWRGCGATSSRCRRRTCACSRAARPGSRAPSASSTRPATPPTTSATSTRTPAGRSSATWPASSCRPTRTRSPRRRRPTSTSRHGSARSRPSGPGSRRRLALTHFGAVEDPPEQLERVRETLREQARLAGEHDQEGFVEAYTRYVREQAGDGADAILQASPLDQLWLGLDRWRSKSGQVS